MDALQEYGFPRDAVIQYLNKNELNSATAAYWLLQMAIEAAAEEEAKMSNSEEETRPPSQQQMGRRSSALSAHGGHQQ